MTRWTRVTAAVVVIACGGVVSACGGSGGASDPAARAPEPARVAPTEAPTTTIPAPTTTSTTAPTFVSSVTPVTAADLGASWRPGCPVSPDQLRRVTLGHWDLDGRTQTGALVVHADVAESVVAIFGRLFEHRVPIRRIEPIDRYGGSDDASMADDNTSAFNCRLAVSSGPPQWSSHAYGRAIDLNPVENPYVFGGGVLPPAGAAFLDRADVRPGMAVAGGPVVDAFAAAGWQWGGRWSGSPDYQHFSADGG